MKLLCCCDQGINRSVHLASLLKHSHDTIAIGLATNSPETQKMLCDWADKILITDEIQRMQMPQGYKEKTVLINIGPDIYPRPYNQRLKVKIFHLLDKAAL
jgi:hypothetical protein